MQSIADSAYLHRDSFAILWLELVGDDEHFLSAVGCQGKTSWWESSRWGESFSARLPLQRNIGKGAILFPTSEWTATENALIEFERFGWFDHENFVRFFCRSTKVQILESNSALWSKLRDILKDGRTHGNQQIGQVRENTVHAKTLERVRRVLKFAAFSSANGVLHSSQKFLPLWENDWFRWNNRWSSKPDKL